MVRLRAADGASSDVYLHGAHVTSWCPAGDGEERLFLSERSEFRDGTAIRGGIPIIFPQFAAEGPLPRHGFARTRSWSFDKESHADDGSVTASLSLSDSEETRTIWPARFLATLKLRVGGDALVVTLQVVNKGDAQFTFAAALHSYLRVVDIRDATVTGLSGTHYRESSAPGVFVRDDAQALRITGEVDRVYLNAPHITVLTEPQRSLEITRNGFPDVVLWNPGAEKASKLADLEPGGERRMLCIEPGVIQRPVTVMPGEAWSGSATFRAVPNGER